MKTITDIEQKIETLKTKKETLLKKISDKYFKQSKAILKQGFSPELSLVILESSWNSASSEQKEEWQKAAQKFPLTRTKNSS